MLSPLQDQYVSCALTLPDLIKIQWLSLFTECHWTFSEHDCHNCEQQNRVEVQQIITDFCASAQILTNNICVLF